MAGNERLGSTDVMAMYIIERLKECSIQVNDIPSLKEIADSVPCTDTMQRVKQIINNFRNTMIIGQTRLIPTTANLFPGNVDDFVVMQGFETAIMANLLNAQSDWSHIYMFVIVTAELCVRSVRDGNINRVAWVNKMAGFALSNMQHFFDANNGWEAAPDVSGMLEEQHQRRRQRELDQRVQEQGELTAALDTIAKYGAALLKLALELRTSRYGT